MARIDAFLKLGRDQSCSDIHLAVGMPPLIRSQGILSPIKYRDLSILIKVVILIFPMKPKMAATVQIYSVK